LKFFYRLMYLISLIDLKLAEERGDAEAYRHFIEQADTNRMRTLTCSTD
jgi:hypothetical protein